MRINIICAMAKNGTIGSNNELPWKDNKEYKWDMDNFRLTTINHTVVMGYKTFESMKFHKLKNRTNIIISHSSLFDLFKEIGETDINAFENLDKAIAYLSWINEKTHDEDIYIIGGEKLYREALEKDYVDKIILSVFDKDFEGDRKFPLEYLPNKFTLKNTEIRENGRILTYIRNNI